jgi:hypothetical protein
LQILGSILAQASATRKIPDHRHEFQLGAGRIAVDTRLKHRTKPALRGSAWRAPRSTLEAAKAGQKVRRLSEFWQT